MSFYRAVQITFKAEGGYVNDKDDRGGETNMGVTATTLKKAIKRGIVSKDTTVKNITATNAMAIYKAFYWDVFGLDVTPWPISLLAFDANVHHGQSQAVNIIQRAVNDTEGEPKLKVDGRWGPLTKGAMNSLAATSAVKFARNILIERKAVMDKIILKNPSQLEFKNGWYARINNLANVAGVGII